MKHMRTRQLAIKSEWPRASVVAAVYIILSVVWFGAVGLSMVDSGAAATRFHLTVAQVHLVQLVFALPGLLILLAILFASIRIWRYARAITGSKEAVGFQFVAYGILTLLAGLVVGNYLGGLQQLAAKHAADPQHVKTVFVIVSNYVSLVAAFVTYALLLQGSRLLLRSIGKRLELARVLTPMLLGGTVLTVAYVWLIHGNPSSQKATSPDLTPAFGLPYWLTVLTVALPYVVAWFVGVLALVGMYQYRMQTRGIVYKMLFKKLIVGMTLFIGLTILLQLLTQISSVYATSSLTSILGLIVFVYGVLAYAFVLIAQGAKRLNSIENLLIE